MSTCPQMGALVQNLLEKLLSIGYTFSQMCKLCSSSRNCEPLECGRRGCALALEVVSVYGRISRERKNRGRPQQIVLSSQAYSWRITIWADILLSAPT